MIAQRPTPNLRLPRSGLITMRRLRWFAAWVAEHLGHHIEAAGVQMLRDTNRSHILHWLPEGAIGPEGERGEIGPVGLPGDPSDIPGPPGVAGKTGPKGLKGNPGPRGDPGDDGKPGKDGVSGWPGTDGVDAPDGPKGVEGPRGSPDPGEKGDKGPPGNQGPHGLNILGIKGEPGNQPANRTTVIGPQLDGYKGDKGTDGTPGDVEKTALLETSDGIIGMAALEGEEALFKDHVTAPLTAGFVAVDLDAVFKGTVEPNTIFVQHAFIPRCHAAIGAKIVHMAGRTWAEARVHPAPRIAAQVTFTIAGIRKGCSHQRLPIFTREQMAANNHFYASAHHGLTS